MGTSLVGPLAQPFPGAHIPDAHNYSTALACSLHLQDNTLPLSHLQTVLALTYS